MIQWLKNKLFPSRVLHAVGTKGSYTGEIVFDEVLMIGGVFCGSLKVNTENKTRLTHLVIEKTGKVVTSEKPIDSAAIDEVEIYGTFEGHIRCRHLFIAKTARVQFTQPLEVETMTLEPGAQFSGQVTVTGERQKKKAILGFWDHFRTALKIGN